MTKQLSVQYGRHRVLSDIQLEVKQGQFIGLLGANGSGKSTLIRTMMGFLKPTAGDIYIHGKTIKKYTIKELAQKIAYVPQDTNVDFDFTIRQLVEMGRHPHQSRFGSDAGARSKVEYALEATQLLQLQHRSILELSGGQRQKAFIAKAVAQEPDLFVLDEPISALDIRHQLEVLGLVRQLTRNGSAAISAIHDVNLAARFCDQIVLLSEGTILAAGRPEEVLTEAHMMHVYGVQSVVRKDAGLQTVQVTAMHPAADDKDKRRNQSVYETA